MNKPKHVNRLLFAMFFVYLGAMLLIGVSGINMNTAGSLLTGQLLYLVPCLLYVLIMRIPLKREIPLRKVKITTLFKILLFTMLLYPVMAFLNLISMLFVTNHFQESVAQLNGAHFFRNLLLMAVIPAVAEEFIFRGVFYGAYRKRSRLFGAAAGGLVFGMAHMNLNQFCYAFVLGFVMCLLIEATGSILSSVFLHFLINGWSVVVLWGSDYAVRILGQDSAAGLSSAAESVTNSQLLEMAFPLSVIAIISAALAACVLVWISKGCRREEYLKETFALRGFRMTREEYSMPGEVQTVESRIVTPVFAVNVLLFFGFMIWFG